MTTTQSSHILIVIGVVASLLIAIVYLRTGAKVRKQGRRLGWATTVLTLLSIAAILYIAFHGNVFQFLVSPTHTGVWSFSTGTARPSASLAHAVVATPVQHSVNRVSHAKRLMTHRVALQKVVAQASQQHLLSLPSAPAHPAPLLFALEGIASIMGISMVLCLVLVGLLLLVRHLRQRQEDAFLDAPSSGCAVCGQEGEFPAYRDRRRQLAHLCSSCVKQFQVTPVA